MKRYASPVCIMALLFTGCGAAAQAAPGSAPALAAGLQDDGRQIFESVCAQCHTVQPPADKAPPMSHIARHYRDQLADRTEAIARIEEWLRAPAANRSLLPEHAIEMWGLMPPVQLQAGQTSAVAGYVYSLADTAAAAPGPMPMRRGRGMMMSGRMQPGMREPHRHGMMRDTTARGPRQVAGIGPGCPLMRRDTLR